MPEIKIRGSIYGMNKEEWNMAAGADYFLSYEYLSHVEMTMTEGYRYRYVMISREGVPMVCASVFLTDIKMDTLLDTGWMKKFVEGVRKIVPASFRIPTIVIGSPPSVGNFGIGIKEGSYVPEEIALLCNKLDEMMVKEKAGMILYKEIPETFMKRYGKIFRDAGIHFGYDMPNNFLDIKWKNDAEYLGSMRGKSRQAIRSSDKKLADGDVRSVILTDIKAAVGEREYDMYHRVLMKSENIFEILTKEYFCQINKLEKMKPCLVAVMEKEDVIGYFLCCDSKEEEVAAMFAGIDYKWNRKYDVYFNLFHQVVIYAMQRGKKRVCFGQNTYEVKQRMGCRTEEMYIGFRHRNHFWDGILSLLSPILLPKTEIKTRRVFKQGA